MGRRSKKTISGLQNLHKNKKLRIEKPTDIISMSISSLVEVLDDDVEEPPTLIRITIRARGS
jgi:hypothetical protein